MTVALSAIGLPGAMFAASAPFTVIEIAPNVVTQIRTQETDGYSAVQIGAGEIKARNTTIPLIAHDAKAGTAPKRYHREFRADDSSAFEVGQDTDYEFHTGYQDGAFQANQATTAIGLMSRILLGYRRSHPFCIGSGNKILADQMIELPKNGNWERLNVNAQYPMYFMYYGTLAMHQMGGRYWRAWNQKIKKMYPDKQRKSPPELAGSWDPDTAVLNGGRLFSTAMSILSLETYYRFSPLMGKSPDEEEKK